MTPTCASLTVLHVANAPTSTRWQRLRVELEQLAPEAAVAQGHAADVALVELGAEACVALLGQLRATNPGLALVARLREEEAHREPELVSAGADEVLIGEAPIEALELAIRAALDRRKSAEQAHKLRQHQRKTERALEDIVSAASHELRSPLSVIIGFGGLLVNDLSGELGPAAIEPTRKILRSAERLETLIRELVLYARLERDLGSLQPVNAGVCADLAIAELATEVHNTGAIIERGTMPRCIGDVGFVQHIFSELLKNALRFRLTRPPQIALGGQRDGERTLYFVQDNGPGFDPRHKNEVFRLFRRLAPRTADTVGDGVGLALCRRMVELMEGEIGLDVVPGQGVRAWFTLPGGESGGGPLR